MRSNRFTDLAELSRLLGGRDCLPLEQIGDDEQRQEQVNQRGQEHALDYGKWRDLAADPEHRGCHIADHRPSATGIRGDHNHRCKEQAVALTAREFLHEGNHDNRRCQIVEHGTEKKGYEADNPHQGGLFPGADLRSDDLETIMSVDHLNNGHGSDQEEYNLSGGSDRTH